MSDGNSRFLSVPTIQMHTRTTRNSLPPSWIWWCLFLGLSKMSKTECKRLREYVYAPHEIISHAPENEAAIIQWALCLCLRAVPICRNWRGVSRARLFILIRGADNTELDEKVYRLDMVNSRKLIFRIFSMWNLFVNCIFSAQRQIHFSCIFIACASASVENIAGYLARREHTNHSSSYFFHILYHSCSLQSSLF